MTDREGRLCRAAVRLAEAARLIDMATIDLGAVCPERNHTGDRLARSVRWLARAARRELGREEAGAERPE